MKQQHLRWVGDLPSSSADRRVTGPRVPCGVPAQTRADRRNRQSPTSVIGCVVRGGFRLFQSENNFNRLFVVDDLWVSGGLGVSQVSWAKPSADEWNLPLGKVACILPKGVVAAEYVDDCQENLVRCVVKIDDLPVDTFVSPTEMNFVEDLVRNQFLGHHSTTARTQTYRDIDEVQAECAQHQVCAESRPDDQRYRQHEWRKEVKQRLVQFLEDEDLGANLPDPQLPGPKDVGHVVEHSVDEEEVPSKGALLENRHFAETATGAAAREQYGTGGFRLDEDGAAHGNAATEFTGCMAEEPVFRH